MRRIAAIALVLSGALGAAACESSSVAVRQREACSGPDCLVIRRGQDIEIGSLLWIRTQETETGIDSERGVELAIDYLDGEFDGVDGTILGHRVTLVSEDDGCSAEGGRAGAQRLLTRPNLLAVVGTTCSGSALDAADAVFGAANVPLISPSNTAPVLTEPEQHVRQYLRTAPNDRIQGLVDADFARQNLKAETAVTIADARPYPKALDSVFAERFSDAGGTVQAQLLLPDAAGDPAVTAAIVAPLAANPPNVIFVPESGAPCSAVLRAVRAEPRLSAPRIVTADGCLTSTVLKDLGDLAYGVYASGPNFSALGQDAFYTGQFLPAYETLYGTSPTGSWHAHAFDAASLVFDALRRTAVLGADGSLSISRTDLLRQLYRTDGYEGLSGRLECLQSGDCAQAARIAIYAAPAWPVAEGVAGAKPIFSKEVTLLQAFR